MVNVIFKLIFLVLMVMWQIHTCLEISGITEKDQVCSNTKFCTCILYLSIAM